MGFKMDQPAVQTLDVFFKVVILFTFPPGDSVQQTGVITLLYCDKHLRLDGQHGENHEGPGTQGQLHHGLHDGQEAPGDQP